MTRRTFVWTTGAVELLQAREFRHPLGVQMWDALPGEPEPAYVTFATLSVLKKCVEIGYSELEIDSRDLRLLAPLLTKQEYGLKLVSCHVVNSEAIIAGDLIAWRSLVRDFQTYGLDFITLSHGVPKSPKTGTDYYKELADKVNHAAEEATRVGLRLCYKSSAFELAGAPGRRPFDTLLQRLDRTIGFELDVFSASVAGQDPVELLNLLRGRVPLLNMRDRVSTSSSQFSEEKEEEELEIGAGSLRFVPILRAAENAGVKHYFVGLSHPPLTKVSRLKQSFVFLRGVNL